MGSKERITRKKNELQASIMEVALDILSTEGIEAVSMRRIANQIEYTAPIIYCHYRNKEALFLALLAHGYQLLNKAVSEAVSMTSTSFVRLEQMMNCYLDFAIENRELYMLMFRIGLVDPTSVTDLPEAALFMRTIEREVAAYGVELGGQEDLDTTMSYFNLISLAHGMVSVNYFSNQFSKVELKKNLQKMLKSVF